MNIRLRIISSSSRATNRPPSPRQNSSLRAIFPPQAQSIDKEHGRVECRRLWSMEVDGATLGLAGAAQISRIVQRVA